MKRLIFSFLAFPIALLIGLVAFHVLNSEEAHIEVFTVEVPTVANREYSEPTGDPVIEHDNNVDRFSESFSDDSHIGRRGKNKVEIRCFDSEDKNGITAEIKFYTRTTSRVWKLKQSLEFHGYSLGGCDPKFEDFNNDGLKDLTYRSNIAARGANVVRTLFIYDKRRDELVRIKNSEEYPNLAYNKKLNCLDAWMFHGATTTVFLKIEGDILREFASVNTGLERIASVVEKNGTERIISRKKMREEDIYTRYSNFDPPTHYPTP